MSNDIDIVGSAIKYLKNYDGPEFKVMEICGTHTAEITHHGIRSMLSKKIKLVSGPGCPVCVTVTSYVDKLIELSKDKSNVIVTFGDMMHVTGSKQSLSDAKSNGANVKIVYSPLETLDLAKENPTKTYIFAAVGFETTTPIYAIMIENAIENDIQNIKLLLSLKTMPRVIDWVCEKNKNIDAFLAPGHVSTITGSKTFEELSIKHKIPFAIAGFTGDQIIKGLAALVLNRGQGKAINLYTTFVTHDGNVKAKEIVDKYFENSNASWRGFGIIDSSGLLLKKEFEKFDAGSKDLDEDRKNNPKCCCANVLTGEITPDQCPLFANDCNPQNQQGACMVSREGTCYHYYLSKNFKH